MADQNAAQFFLAASLGWQPLHWTIIRLDTAEDGIK